MKPAAQTHFNAQVRPIDTGYQRKAYHVNMQEYRCRSNKHRKREARTQPANMTHRLEEKRRKSRNKKHETSSHASAEKRLSKKKTHTTVSPLKTTTDCKVSKRDP